MTNPPRCGGRWDERAGRRRWGCRPRLVVLGDPGSGKTTLLRYIALLYASDLAGGTRLVAEKLGLDEAGALPILLPLRQIGRYLAQHRPQDDGTEGHAVLLDFFIQVLKNERIEVPPGFFDEWLQGGRAAVLLDGLDEVADPDLRRRVSRLVDAFTRTYDRCRVVVTSRLVGYTDASRLSQGYAATTVRDFSLGDVRQFLSQWHRLVAIGQMGPGETAETHAANQTRQLLEAIDKQEYLAALAIAGRDDYLDYSLRRSGDDWWRETILLEAGYLSTQSREKTTRLISALADARAEPEPYHNLALAAECLRGAGANRILGDLERALRGRLRRELETPVARGRRGAMRTLLTRGMSLEKATNRRIAATEALSKIGGNRFWTAPYGEPEWERAARGGEDERAYP